jgi:hypothetical protein
MLFENWLRSVRPYWLANRKQRRRLDAQQRQISRQPGSQIQQLEQRTLLTIASVFEASLAINGALVFDGTPQDQVLIIETDDSGFLRHNLAGVDDSLVSAMDFDSSQPGEQALLEADLSSLTVRGDAGDSVRLDDSLQLSANVLVTAGNVYHGGSITSRGGSVIFDADDLVEVSGDVDVSSATGVGGVVNILGDRVTLSDGASIDASGELGGGTVLVGGDLRGEGSVRTAQETSVDAGARISVDAVRDGDGGTAVVWADGTTRFYGEISAQGGTDNGDGGTVEVSGKQDLELGNLGGISLYAENGSAGTLLLDPNDISIVDGTASFVAGSPLNANTINDADIISFLTSSGSLVIETTGTGGSGDITIDGAVDVTWSSANNLTLNADRDLAVNAGAVINSTGSTI